MSHWRWLATHLICKVIFPINYPYNSPWAWPSTLTIKVLQKSSIYSNILIFSLIGKLAMSCPVLSRTPSRYVLPKKGPLPLHALLSPV
jgi:hypothetical protein